MSERTPSHRWSGRQALRVAAAVLSLTAIAACSTNRAPPSLTQWLREKPRSITLHSVKEIPFPTHLIPGTQRRETATKRSSTGSVIGLVDVVSDCAEAGAGCLLLLPLYAIVGGGIYAIYHATATEDTWTYHPLADDDQVRTVFASVLEETDFRTTLPQEIVNQAVRRSRHDIRFQPEAWIVVPKFQDGSANGSLKVLMDHVGFVSRSGKVNEVSLQIRSHANLYVVREQELVEYRSPEISYESEREDIDRWLENRGALLRRELKTATEAVAGQIVDWISSSNESGTTRWIGVPRRRVLQLLQSAQDGDAEAQWHLGNISLEENAKLHWYCKAAETGNSRYLFEIGTLHLQQALGDGAKPVLAYVYFDLAARNGPGVPRYADYRDRTGAQLEPEEIAEAERLAVDWTPKRACPEGVS